MHISKSQFPSEPVPEQIEVAAGLALEHGRETATDCQACGGCAKNFQGGAEQKNMTRSTGLEQRHDGVAQI